MIAVLLAINIVLAILLLRVLKSRGSRPRSRFQDRTCRVTDAAVPPVREALPESAIPEASCGAETGTLSAQEAEIAAVVNNVRLVNVTPEPYREKLREPVPSLSAPVLAKLKGPMARIVR